MGHLPMEQRGPAEVSGTLHYGQCSQMDEQKISAGSGNGVILQKGKSACSLLREQLKIKFSCVPEILHPPECRFFLLWNSYQVPK